MRISDRYRLIYEGVNAQLDRLKPGGDEEIVSALQALCNAADELEAQLETVGEIPQIKLEQRLSPVLLTVHAQLDRARVHFESAGQTQQASNIWELEQQVYRLLNDL